MEDISWITAGNGEKLWPNWRVNSRLKTFKFKLKKSTELSKQTIEGYLSSLYAQFVSCGLYECQKFEREILFLCSIRILDDLKDVGYWQAQQVIINNYE